MEQNTQKDEQFERVIKLCKIALERYEPYPLDEPKLQMFDNDLDENRMTATLAKKYLLEHGINIDD